MAGWLMYAGLAKCGWYAEVWTETRGTAEAAVICRESDSTWSGGVVSK
jgi:hypothetical protein